MKLEQVSLSEIRGPAFNIRGETGGWDDDLFESIKTHGLKQPILLRPTKKGFEIVAGSGGVARLSVAVGGALTRLVPATGWVLFCDRLGVGPSVFPE